MRPRNCIAPACRGVLAVWCWLLLVSFSAFGFAAPAARPKLVVAIVIDQFRYDYLLRFQKDYTTGLARLLSGGAVFTDAHYLHSYTVTAVGHSTFLSGATPSESGIIANDWFDRQTNKTVTSVSDNGTKTVGGATGEAGSSPKRLTVSTVGDELKSQGGDSHVIGISIKDRAAILPSGHMADAAYWYDDDAKRFVTSSYYREDLPEWVKAANGQGWYKRAFGAQWFPLAGTVSGEQATQPFCTMVAGSSEVPFCGTIEATPRSSCAR